MKNKWNSSTFWWLWASCKEVQFIPLVPRLACAIFQAHTCHHLPDSWISPFYLPLWDFLIFLSFMLHHDWRSKFYSISKNWHFGSSHSGSACKSSEKPLHPSKSYNLYMEWITTTSCISSLPTQHLSPPLPSSPLISPHFPFPPFWPPQLQELEKKLLEYSKKSWKLQMKNNLKCCGLTSFF